MGVITRDHLIAVEHRKQATDKLVAKLDTIVEQQADELMATQPLVTSEAGQANLLKQMGINTTSEILTHLDEAYVVIPREDYENNGGLLKQVLAHELEQHKGKNPSAQETAEFLDETVYTEPYSLVNLGGDLYNSFFRDINS